MKVKTAVTMRFSAAHSLPFYRGKCRDLHGHNYTLRVEVIGDPKETGTEAGMVRDFHIIENAITAQCLAYLDHKFLNGVVDNPTAENLAVWIWGRLAPLVTGLHSVTLWETDDYSAEVRG